MITTIYVHDVTLMGSIIGEGRAEDPELALKSAEACAARRSLEYPGRLVRVHDIDDIDVVSEFRNGEKQEIQA